MTALGRIRAILATAALAVMTCLGAPAMAQSPGYMKLTAGDSLQSRPIYLGVNKSMVVDLPGAAGDVLVSNPQIADAVLRTSTRLYLIGVEVGQASVFLFDSTGGQIATFDIYVEADLGVLNQLLAESITDGYVRAEAINRSIILRGEVGSSTSAGRAVQLTQSMMAARLTSTTNSTVDATGASPTVTSSTDNLSGGPGIINLITILGEEQVALKVTIAEVQRSIVKQLGINASAMLSDAIDLTYNNPSRFPFSSALTRGSLNISDGDQPGPGSDDGIDATIEALEETRMLRTLAEPTLTAVSGETANFLAGGEFPVPVAGDDGSITVEFKQFGVNLAFTPVVLAPGRIVLKLRSEVSDISATGAVSLPLGNGFSVTIPATSVRRAETSIELPSGGSFMMAGLIQEDTRRAASGLPWLQNLPILGALFSSKDFLSNQTELVMIVTAYLVTPTAPRNLARPDDNLVLANDAEAYFLNRLTKVYGADAGLSGGTASAPVGFTFD